jgi:hypothetical protein
MLFTNPNNIYKILRGIIQKELALVKGISIWKVTEIDSSNYTVNIRDLNFKQLQYTEVPILGMGMGHYKGILKFPEVDDLVLVAFLGGTSLKPIVLGTLLDSFTQSPDGVIQINANELFITQKTYGSIIFIKADNTIEMRVPDSTGDLTKGARMRLSPDGSWKLFNKDNYGIECDSSGNVTIRGVTVNHTQTAGTF